MKFLVRRKTIIEEFAIEIANLQREADKWYYEKGDRDHADWLLVRVGELRDFAERLGICQKMYEEAYKIYDFRNSGRNGYTLKDGVVVKDNKEEVCK